MPAFRIDLLHSFDDRSALALADRNGHGTRSHEQWLNGVELNHQIADLREHPLPAEAVWKHFLTMSASCVASQQVDFLKLLLSMPTKGSYVAVMAPLKPSN
jgi:hypothetical protein